jgi:hypothetical protein
MEPIHTQVLRAACRIADPAWVFSVADLISSLPQLNAATVRTHVASRCGINAPSNHASRYRYFRSTARGMYRIEPAFRRSRRDIVGHKDWQDRLLAAIPPSIDSTLITESLKLTPTERLETMRRAAASFEAMRGR